LVEIKDDLGFLFLHLRENPSLCEISLVSEQESMKTRRYGCRLAEHYHHDTTDAILGGVPDSSQEDEEEEGDVVAVFGEIVEDPTLATVAEPCDDPTVVRDEVKRLNRQVLEGFVKLVQDLVHRPMENKYVLRNT